MNIGDTVCFSRKFLSDICDYSYESAQRRGVVTKVRTDGFIEVKWCDQEQSVPAHASNLVDANKLHFEPR